MEQERIENVETTPDAIHRFAHQYKGNAQAAEVLMSFCRGECLHFRVSNRHHYDLCGDLIG